MAVGHRLTLPNPGAPPKRDAGTAANREATRLQKRAEALDETRNRIIWATMQLHGEKGVATTSQADVAARAGVSPATVYRHFPTFVRPPAVTEALTDGMVSAILSRPAARPGPPLPHRL
jgi:AcrR family transcriptional regulator